MLCPHELKQTTAFKEYLEDINNPEFRNVGTSMNIGRSSIFAGILTLAWPELK